MIKLGEWSRCNQIVTVIESARFQHLTFVTCCCESVALPRTPVTSWQPTRHDVQRLLEESYVTPRVKGEVCGSSSRLPVANVTNHLSTYLIVPHSRLTIPVLILDTVPLNWRNHDSFSFLSTQYRYSVPEKAVLIHEVFGTTDTENLRYRTALILCDM